MFFAYGTAGDAQRRRLQFNRRGYTISFHFAAFSSLFDQKTFHGYPELVEAFLVRILSQKARVFEI